MPPAPIGPDHIGTDRIRPLDRVGTVLTDAERIERAARAAVEQPAIDHRGRTAADRAAVEDQAARTSFAVESYLTRRRVLEAALQDIAVLKHTLRQIVTELEPRLQGIEGRLVVLARTVGNLLAELDRGHTTTVTRLRNPTQPAAPDPHVETTKVDPSAPTPLPDERP